MSGLMSERDDQGREKVIEAELLEGESSRRVVSYWIELSANDLVIEPLDCGYFVLFLFISDR